MSETPEGMLMADLSACAARLLRLAQDRGTEAEHQDRMRYYTEAGGRCVLAVELVAGLPTSATLATTDEAGAPIAIIARLGLEARHESETVQ